MEDQSLSSASQEQQARALLDAAKKVRLDTFVKRLNEMKSELKIEIVGFTIIEGRSIQAGYRVVPTEDLKS